MGCGASKGNVTAPAAAPAPTAAPVKEVKPAKTKPVESKPVVETPPVTTTTTEKVTAPAEEPKNESAAAEPATEAVPTDEPIAPATAAEDDDVKAGVDTDGNNGNSTKFKLTRKEPKQQTPLEKFHSSLRWNKISLDEMKAFLIDDSTLVSQPDERNGNVALHITCQNGHFELTKWLIGDCGVDVNAVNGKGQSALHMSISYDFYEQTDYLLSNNADKDLTNQDGHKAYHGIDGDHTGKWEHGSVMHKFKAVTDVDTLKTALDGLEAAEVDMLDKLTLVQTGLRLKKLLGEEVWEGDRFTEICKRVTGE